MSYHLPKLKILLFTVWTAPSTNCHVDSKKILQSKKTDDIAVHAPNKLNYNSPRSLPEPPVITVVWFGSSVEQNWSCINLGSRQSVEEMISPIHFLLLAAGRLFYARPVLCTEPIDCHKERVSGAFIWLFSLCAVCGSSVSILIRETYTNVFLGIYM